jgi:bis(5'-nucleosyl)-tetraphosphatase (symmetrical)
MATYAIGDIQGCYKQLRLLLEKVDFDPETDRLWSVGDLVNRGPKSLKTLRFLKNLGSSFTAVLGNHDLHLLALYYKAYSAGRKDDLISVMEAPDAAELCDWLRHLPLLYQQKLTTRFGEEEFVLVHAGLAPGWSLEQAKTLAGEVECALQGEHFFDYLKGMYGNKPDTWTDDLQGEERLRVITNYLTRSRFSKRNGKLDFSVKTGAETAPLGYRPWFEYQSISPACVILFGHWAALNGVTSMPNVYALDTGCVWGRCLSMLRLEDRQVFSVKCRELKAL